MKFSNKILRIRRKYAKFLVLGLILLGTSIAVGAAQYQTQTASKAADSCTGKSQATCGVTFNCGWRDGQCCSLTQGCSANQIPNASCTKVGEKCQPGPAGPGRPCVGLSCVSGITKDLNSSPIDPDQKCKDQKGTCKDNCTTSDCKSGLCGGGTLRRCYKAGSGWGTAIGGAPPPNNNAPQNPPTTGSHPPSANQEAQCTAKSGQCQQGFSGTASDAGAACDVGGKPGKVELNLCPSQPNSVRCCVPNPVSATSTIQGFKVDETVNKVSELDAASITYSLSGSGTKTSTLDNPYFFKNLPNGSYEVQAGTVTGWHVVGYTLCSNATDCHKTKPTPGDKVTVSLTGGYADLWWHYAKGAAPAAPAAPGASGSAVLVPDLSVYLRTILEGVGPGASPTAPSVPATLKIFKGDGPLTSAKYSSNDSLTYVSASGRFENPNFKLGTVPSGIYQMVLQIPKYLDKQLTTTSGSKAITMTTGTNTDIAPIEMKAGDVVPAPNGDNVINMIDYNAVLGCMPDAPSGACLNKKLADINDDGKVDQADLNIIQRNFGEQGFSFQTDQFKCDPDPTCTQGNKALQLCSLVCSKKTQRS